MESVGGVGGGGRDVDHHQDGDQRTTRKYPGIFLTVGIKG